MSFAEKVSPTKKVLITFSLPPRQHFYMVHILFLPLLQTFSFSIFNSPRIVTFASLTEDSPPHRLLLLMNAILPILLSSRAESAQYDEVTSSRGQPVLPT